ncbi:hypothetical protein HGQ17_02515 [Nesterenkonia sp. MY13]|uniref:FAD-binding domain-containing protein n=1 Tax=Nesterenkonia sedimenti TaxID=1463632 RepID=A0A7X8THM3_9MICC|nr:FAD-dependent monooxygenase [Nesterenkonia sedimenti]NLS08892.1 hypothetical protein [Nesterenkonia sedimenti]
MGVTVIRGIIREEIEINALEEIWRPDGLLGVTPHPDGGANWFATVPQTRFDSPAQALEALHQRWKDHSELPQTVLRFASPEHTLVNDLWESRWPRRLNRRNAVLLGDAAHAMSPNLGRGANESLIDAVTLGSALSGTPLSLRRAIRQYQRRRSLPPHMIRIASRVMLRLASTSREGLRDALFWRASR